MRTLEEAGRAWPAPASPVLVFGLALGLLLAMVALLAQQSRRETQARDLVAHTLQVQEAVASLDAELLQVEGEHRAFLVKGDPRSVAAREAALTTALSTVAKLRALTRDHREQQGRLAEIEHAIGRRVSRMRDTTLAARAAGLEAVRERFDPFGASSLRPVRTAIAAFAAAEANRYRARARAAAGTTAQLRWLQLLTPLLAITVLAGGLIMLLRQLRRSERISGELGHALELLDATYDAVLVYDAADWRIRYANRGAAEQLGYPRESLLAMNVLDIKCEFDAEGFRRQLAPLLNGAVDALSFETMHRKRDGSQVPVEVSARLASLQGGTPSVATIARDLSERRQAQGERDRFFSLSLDMLCIAGADGYFKRLSPAFTRTLGWSVPEMLARPFLHFVHPDDQVATLAEVERQVRDGQPVLNFENRYQHKDGSWRVLSWRSAPQPDGTMYASARDVTESRQAQERIVELNGQLLQRQASLEQANKELESFSYSVSHDLRAPLRHVDGYARMLREDVGHGLGDEARRYLDTIVDSARRMGMLIDDLLAFSRLGRKPLSSRNVDMQELVRGAVAEIEAQRGGEPVPIEVGELPQADGDPALLRQVWTNLLSNAIKYSGPRGAQARVRVTGEQRGDRLHYSVLDNGVGFDMRYADKLFGVFQRLHTQDEFEGTGVGLAIVQRIVQRHGGAVSAQADPGHGACFSFQLPASEEFG